MEQESVIQQSLVDQSSKIAELEEEIRHYELDREAAESLALDFKQLKEDFNSKNGEYIANLQALSNLQLVLEKLQSDFNAERGNLIGQLEEFKKFAEIGQSAQRQLEELQEQMLNKETTIAELRKELKSSRKYTVKLEGENSELRKTLQATIARLDNFSSDENLVDRRLVTQLLVAYVEGKRSRKEVVDLMSKILQFTDEEKHRVGVVPAQSSTYSMLSSLYSYVAPRPASNSTAPTPTESTPRVDTPDSKKNLGDLWIDFLLSETDDQQVKRQREKEIEAARATALGVNENSESEREANSTADPSAPVEEVKR
eukprot:TRINITY_DN8163_c0_g1_i3.p1 TRINITY_DN8163_c0_g1~~TRINITY_DN8163_c0_g1_i3.p1  ORF type:complete len:314 (+),score=79.35 TRINITY_DN8163_c0_g1_i3:82-1023(+)